jgi:hypothetical protein
MIKLRKMLIAVVATASLMTSAFAGEYSFGVTGSFMDLDAKGTETDRLTAAGANVADTSTRTKAISEDAFTGSIYIEYTADTRFPFTIGGEYTPGTVDIGGKFTRTDTETSATGEDETVSITRGRNASASASNFSTLYTELSIWKALYVRAGMSNISVNHSNDSLMTGQTDLNGTNLGLGFKGKTNGGVQWKLSYQETDYDTLNLRSSGNSVAANSTGVKADLDTTAVRFSLGKSF